MLRSALSIVEAAIAVGILILVHEFGHFIAAKAVGVRVEVFSIGFWRKLVGFQKGETEYRISLIPLGGYVKLAGEIASESSGDPGEFCSKTPGQRAIVFVAGVFMNMVLAVVGYVAAFSIGVPFPVAEVGQLQKDMPAWKAGLRRGDKVERINSIEAPDFKDVQHEVAIKSVREIEMDVKRDGELYQYNFATEYDDLVGIRRIGIGPPIKTVVNGLVEVGQGENKRCPAREAGVELMDKIVSVNGVHVETVSKMRDEIDFCTRETLPVRVIRKGREEPLELEVNLEPSSRYVLGISYISAGIKSLQGDGMAELAGLRPKDRIVEVNGKKIENFLDLERAVQESFGTQKLLVQRGETQQIVEVDIPDKRRFEDFKFSIKFQDAGRLTWLREEGPAWEAGMRPGDKIVKIGRVKTESWQDILRANGRAGNNPREIVWEHDGEIHSAVVEPAPSHLEQTRLLGVIFREPKQVVRKHGAFKAVQTGVYKSYTTIVDIFRTIRGFASRDISTRKLGSVVAIAHGSYLAAQEGLGKLLYITALISAALAFLNILPIPVLDGGHLLFLAIEKIRGKPVSEKVRTVSQIVGLTLLLMLVVYAVRNDILRLLG